MQSAQRACRRLTQVIYLGTHVRARTHKHTNTHAGSFIYIHTCTRVALCTHKPLKSNQKHTIESSGASV